MTCIDFNFPGVRENISAIKQELQNTLNSKQIGLLWNSWLDEDLSRVDSKPTAEDIAGIYSRLSAKNKQQVFDNETIADKIEVIDAMQFMYFHYISKFSEKPVLTRSDISANKSKVFSQIESDFREDGLIFVADNFKSYQEFFEKQRLSKFNTPEFELEQEEQAEKDNISNKSSVNYDMKGRASDEAVYLIASLQSDEEVLGVPKPVNFDTVWNTLQNYLGNSTNFVEQANKLVELNYPWTKQLMDKLGILDTNNFAPESIYSSVRTSFNEAFAKQQSDISISLIGGKESFSSINSGIVQSLRQQATSEFWNGEMSKRVYGQTILDRDKYNNLKLQENDKDLLEFLTVFGINLNPSIEMTSDLRADIIQIKKAVDKYKEDIIWLDDKTLDVKSRVNKVLAVQVPFEKFTKNLSVRNADGELQYALSNHNYFSRTISKLQNGVKKANNLLEFLFAEGIAELEIISGARDANNNESDTYNDLGRTDITSSQFTDMFSSSPIIHLPRSSDKSTERGFKITAKSSIINDYLAYKTITPKLKNDLFKAFESDKNQQFNPDWIYAKNNTPLTFWEQAFGLNNNSTEEDFIIAIDKYIAKERTSLFDQLVSDGVIIVDELDNINNFSFTDSTINKFEFNKATQTKKREMLNQVIDNFNFNSLLFGVLYTQSTEGSMSGVKIDNMYKRYSGPVAEMRQTRVDHLSTNEINNEMVELNLPFKGDSIKVYTYEETIEPSTNKDLLKISNAYEANNVDDAQGVMHIAVYRNLLKLTSQWNPTQEEAFQKIMKGQKLTKNFKSIFPPIKPVGYSLVTISKDGIDYKVPVYIKTAVYPISPIDTKGLTNEDKLNRSITEGIGLFIPKSGIKMAVPKELTSVLGEYSPTAAFEFPMEDIGIQLDINPKESSKQLIGTQQRKLLWTNLFENGKAIDPKYQEWLTKNKETIQQMMDLESEKLYDRAGIVPTEDEGFEIKDYSNLRNMVRDELLSRENPVNVIESIKSIIDEQGNLLGTIDALPARQKVMNLLNSIITNKLIKQYTKGTALVQISQQGWEMKVGSTVETETSIDFIDNKAKQSYIDNNGLQFFRTGEKTASAECLLPAKYKSFVKKDEEGNYIIDDERVLINIGYRIPTQGHNSMLHLKVIGFLPEHLDQMIILPKEITTQGGSDFDVDKINLFIPNTVNVNGQIKFISSDMDAEDIYNKIKEDYENLEATNKLFTAIFGDLGEEEELEDISNKDIFIKNFKLKQLQNELITQTVQVLEDPKVADSLITPNSPGDLKDKAEAMSKGLIENGKQPKKLVVTLANLFSGTTLTTIAQQMFASKALVGVFASQSTHHTLAQQVALHFKTGREFFFDHNKVDGKSSLSGIKDVTGKFISDVIGNNYLTAAVDAAKEDYLTDLGINLDTGDIASLFSRLGGDRDYLYAWLNIPIIQEYLKIKKFNKSITAKATDKVTNNRKIIEEIAKKYGIKNLQYIEENFNKNKFLSDKLLADRESRGNYSSKKVLNNVLKNEGSIEMLGDLFDDFLYFEKASGVLRKAISTSRFDTAGPGKNIIESILLKLNYQQFSKEMEGDFGYTLATYENDSYNRIISDTVLNTFYSKSFNLVTDLYKDMVVLLKSTNIRNSIEALIHPIHGLVNKTSKPDEADTIYGTIINYLIQNNIGLDDSLFFGDDTLAHKIVHIQNNPNHPLHENNVIQEYFNVELSPNNNQPSLLSPKSKSITTEESNGFTQSFEEIKQIDSNLYNELIKAAMFQTGVLQSPTAYYNTIPYIDTTDLTIKAIESERLDNTSEQILDEVLANIGNKVTGLQKVKLFNRAFTDGLIKLNKKELEKAGGKQYINIIFTSPFGESKPVIAKAISDDVYMEIKSKNKGVLFYNLTKKDKFIAQSEEDIIVSESSEIEEDDQIEITDFENWYQTSEDVNPMETKEWNLEYFKKCVKGK